MKEPLDIHIGWDPREIHSFGVFSSSLTRRSSKQLHIHPLMQQSLRHEGLYTRPHVVKNGQMWDTISGAPMSTDFAITRFLVPHLQREGWCLFAEPDMLCISDIVELFALADDRYALMCVQHDYQSQTKYKMAGKIQASYARKNWSSLMLINAGHPAHRRLTVEMVNSLPGRDLHRFCWLEDEEIGGLPIEWNYLVGEAMPKVTPKIIHYTLGSPEILAPDWLREYDLVRRKLPSEVA